ncbi:MAG: hypothetical protein ACI9MJ_000727 [Alphaproteobacteria bacterium]
MTSVRSSLTCGLLLAFIFTIWCSGAMAIYGWENGLDRKNLSLGLRVLWIAQAVALPIFAIHYATDSATPAKWLGFWFLVIVMMPLEVILWLGGVVSLESLLRSLVFLSGEATVITAILGALCIGYSRILANSIVSAALKMTFAAISFVAANSWLPGTV